MVLEQEAFLVGRILFGGFFVMNGLTHFTKRGMMTGYADSKGVPSPGLMVPLAGLMIILGGLAVILGTYVQLGLGLIALFLLGVTPMMHNFWALEGEERMQQVQNFMRNVALLGAVLALYFAAVTVQDWPYALNLVP